MGKYFLNKISQKATSAIQWIKTKTKKIFHFSTQKPQLSLKQKKQLFRRDVNSNALSSKPKNELQVSLNFENYILEKIKKNSSIKKLNCIICNQILVYSCIIPCGHIYCQKCLHCTTNTVAKCPSCKAPCPAKVIVLLPALDKFIEKIVINHKDQQIKRIYYKRKEDRQKWNKQRWLNYDTIKQGDKVDVLNWLNYWVPGYIQQIIVASQKNKTKIVVRYQSQKGNFDHNERFKLNSKRLAPYQFFTKKEEISFQRNEQVFLRIDDSQSSLNQQGLNINIGQDNPFLDFFEAVVSDVSSITERLQVQNLENNPDDNNNDSPFEVVMGPRLSSFQSVQLLQPRQSLANSFRQFERLLGQRIENNQVVENINFQQQIQIQNQNQNQIINDLGNNQQLEQGQENNNDRQNQYQQ